MSSFKVKTPMGVWADGQWPTESDIPQQIPDRFDIYFSAREQGKVFEIPDCKNCAGMLEPFNFALKKEGKYSWRCINCALINWLDF
jgi:hypothetical protein